MLTTALVLGGAWAVVATSAAVLLGRAIRLGGDTRCPLDEDEGWLDDQPAEVLVPTPDELRSWYELPSATRNTIDRWA